MTWASVREAVTLPLVIIAENVSLFAMYAGQVEGSGDAGLRICCSTIIVRACMSGVAKISLPLDPKPLALPQLKSGGVGAKVSISPKH